MSSDRRRAARFGLWFPLEIRGDDQHVLAVSRDISAVGVSMVAASAIVVGAPVVLTMVLPNASDREIRGTIVRVDTNEADENGLYRHKVAIAFDERVEELEPVLEELSRTSSPPGA